MTESKHVSVKAVLLGVLADLGGGVIVGIVGGIVQTIVFASHGVSPEEVHNRGIDVAGLDPAVVVLVNVLGLGTTALGGYVAGRVARRAEILHGGIVGVIGLPIGVVYVVSGVPDPLWVVIVGFVGAVPLGMVGGFLARRRRESRQGLSNSGFEGES